LTRRVFLAALAQPRTRKPNIIWMMADDMGCRDLGCYGQQYIKTPNMDRLATGGVRFTSTYAGSSVCAPCRSTLMTGQHSGHTRVRWNHSVKTKKRVPLLPSDVTVASVLKKAGYATGITGKWGLGEPNTTGIPTLQGFDEWYGFLNQDHALEYYPDHLWRGPKKEAVPKGAYVTDLFTQEALAFIRKHRSVPFFLYFTPTTPHAPHDAPELGEYKDKPWKPEHKAYAAMVATFDRAVGAILTLLKELNLESETIVFCTSDNGAGNKPGLPFFNGTGPFRAAKGDVYEGGHRVPMIVRWPGRVKPGSTSDYPWVFYDFLPTAAELAGVQPPRGIDGISIAPVLLGKTPNKREYFYWEGHTRGFHQAIRIDNWKGVRHGLKGKLELYDLRSDIAESRDVAAAHREIVARVTKLLEAARSNNEDYPAT